MDKIQLPEQFIRRMQSRLGDGLDAFLKSFEAPSVSAFHLNTAKFDPERITPYLDTLQAKAVPQIPHAFYYSAEGIGRSVLHHSGLLYSQDPAAMLPALCAEMFDGIRILDLCAAPGGKTSQLAIRSHGMHSVILANEPHPSRNVILRQNIERMGYRNILVSRAEPSELVSFYPEFFDLILVDAPCSGEGMFRKYPESIREWSQENVAHCASRQRDILDAAQAMLAPGGQLIYSTCTYAPEEDEEQVKYLSDTYGFMPISVPDEVAQYTAACEYGSRIFYPHLHPGEGQFLASLRKPGSLPAHNSEDVYPLPRANGKLLSAAEEALMPQIALSDEALYLTEIRDNLYVLPAGMERLPEKLLTSFGVILGHMDERGRKFIPHHQFFRAYPELFSMSADLLPDAPEITAYLNGQELSESDHLCVSASSKGYGVLRCLGAGVGGFRYAGGRLKNLYPKGLRNPS